TIQLWIAVCTPFLRRILMVTLGEARKVIAAAEQKAAEIKQPMNIAVVNEGGNLVSHARMDGAWIGSIDISINKAFTSREIRHRCSFYDPGSSVDSVAEPLVP